MSGARYLETLNPEQRRAVEHGVGAKGANIAGPLLVIAGAGSGKTNTLAHRVAHLIVNGADPGRILLLTFSRRAAAEMERRVERIVAAALGERGRRPRPHQLVGHVPRRRRAPARMYAASVGLEPAFTIHDREDSADLMNLVRHELGLSEKAQRFPLKATCLAIYSRAVNAGEPLEAALAKQFPWCAEWKDELRDLFAAYVEAKQKQHVLDYDDLLLYWGELMRVPELAADVGALLRPRAGRRVPGHQRAAGRDPARAQARRRRADRGRRRRPGDLCLPRRDGAQHPGLPAAVSTRRPRSCGWSRTTARPSRSSPPATPSSASPASSSPRTCARTGARASGRRWSRCVDDIGQVSLVVETVLENREAAWRSRSRRCCSAPRTTAPCSRSSSPAATSPSSSSAASSSSRPRTSRTCWRCCAGPRTRPTGSPAFA